MQNKLSSYQIPPDKRSIALIHAKVMNGDSPETRSIPMRLFMDSLVITCDAC